jgi:hypothetical protein
LPHPSFRRHLFADRNRRGLSTGAGAHLGQCATGSDVAFLEHGGGGFVEQLAPPHLLEPIKQILRL